MWINEWMNLLDLVILAFWEYYKLWASLLCNSVYLITTCSFLALNILFKHRHPFHLQVMDMEYYTLQYVSRRGLNSLQAILPGYVYLFIERLSWLGGDPTMKPTFLHCKMLFCVLSNSYNSWTSKTKFYSHVPQKILRVCCFRPFYTIEFTDSTKFGNVNAKNLI
jgi:hypothetical protein